jgi:hypothetical protein
MPQRVAVACDRGDALERVLEQVQNMVTTRNSP